MSAHPEQLITKSCTPCRGGIPPLNAEEAELAGAYNLQPGPVARAWEYWSVRLDKAEGRAPTRARPKSAATKTMRKTKQKAKRRR